METETIFLLGFFTTAFFLILLIIKMKYIDKEYKPLKELVTDGLIVFSSTMIAAYGVFHIKGSFKDFMNVITESKTLDPTAAQVFTDTPSF
jgi:hypothetical protein